MSRRRVSESPARADAGGDPRRCQWLTGAPGLRHFCGAATTTRNGRPSPYCPPHDRRAWRRPYAPDPTPAPDVLDPAELSAWRSAEAAAAKKRNGVPGFKYGGKRARKRATAASSIVRDRRVIALRDHEGKSYAEIAGILGLKLSTATNLYYEARRRAGRPLRSRRRK